MHRERSPDHRSTEITPTLNVSSSRVGALGLSGNNPGLKPYLANNFDLGGEWYYGQNEYLSLDTFFKHVSQFPEQQTVNVTIPGVIDPTTGTNGTVGQDHIRQFADSERLRRGARMAEDARLWLRLPDERNRGAHQRAV